MPTDSVTNRTFRDLFDSKVRFIIPFFQRGYAWERRQWDTLFSDIDDQVLAELDDGVPLSDVEHFFGPIVVQSRGVNDDGSHEFLVVDGQQRITTIYLLLGLIMNSLASKQHLSGSATEYVRRIREILTNGVGPGDDYLRLKVFSTKGDRLPTYRVIFGDDVSPRSDHYDADVRVFRPGHNQVEAFRDFASRRLKAQFGDVAALWRLAQVLLDSLTVVWIPLDQHKDDAQAIFESLNDKGMPLSASELLCSHLFRPLESSSDFEHLHNELWLQAIKTVGDRDKFEEFLRHFYSIGEKKMIGRGRKVYVHYKSSRRNIGAADARRHLHDLKDAADIYRVIADPAMHSFGDRSIRETLIGISHTRMDVSTPFTLAVLIALGKSEINEIQARALLRETLVLLVRRKMTEQPTTIYDTLFPNLMNRIRREPNLVLAIQQEFQDKGVWVSNQEFQEALLRRPLYRTKDTAFTRMVLIELDKALQPHGQLPDYSTLQTIEHTLPQTLDEGWRAYLGTDARDEHLQTVVHTVGNLSLMSPIGNSAVGRDPFEQKKSTYSFITALSRQIKDHPGPWNLAAIRERSAQLAKAALTVWRWGEG